MLTITPDVSVFRKMAFISPNDNLKFRQTTRKGAHPTRNGSSIYYSPSLAEKKEGINSILIHALLKIIVTHIQWGMFSLLCKTENVPPTCCHLMQSHEQRLASLRTPTPLP